MIVYDVELPDGAVKQYAYNTISGNMCTQIDQHVQYYNRLESIIYYPRDGHDMSKEDKYVITKSVTRSLRETNIVWKLLII